MNRKTLTGGMAMLLLVFLFAGWQDTAAQQEQEQVLTTEEQVKKDDKANDLVTTITAIGGILFFFGAMWGVLWKARKDIKEVREEFESEITKTKEEYEEKISKLRQQLDDKIASQVDAQIERQSEAFVNKFFAEKLGIKPDLIKQFFHELNRDNALKSQKILIISETKGQKGFLAEILNGAGFSLLEFRGLEELPAIDTNGVAVILINNEKGQITEDQIKEVFEEYDETARFAYYGEQVSKELFSEYRTKVKFTNNSSYIPDNLLATLKN